MILFMQDTSKQYDAVIDACKSLFEKKMSDYGSAWRILRLPSLTDQIFIKAQRIRGLQQNEVQKVDEGQIKIRKRNSTHSLALDTLDFNTQMKAKFFKANQGIKYKLPACRLNYKVRNKKRGSQYTFTICYDGKSQCYLTTKGHNKEVYFNSKKLTYSIYQSEKGRLELIDKQVYNSENHLEYPTLSRIGQNRKNFLINCWAIIFVEIFQISNCHSN